MELKQSITGELNTHSVKCDLTLPKRHHLLSVYDVTCTKIRTYKWFGKSVKGDGSI